MGILEKLLELFYTNGDKVLIFSQSVKLLDVLQRFIRGVGYRFRRLDGGTKSKDRMKIVTEFNHDPDIFVFLISTKAGGVGLNITGANKVVVFEPSWNPAHDLQAQDRAYRIGQVRDVNVYRLVTVGTLEENIYLRQVHKQHLEKVGVRSEQALRLFDVEEVLGFQKMVQLREGPESLTETFLKRKNCQRRKLLGLDTFAHEINACTPSSPRKTQKKRGGTPGKHDSTFEMDDSDTGEDLGAGFVCENLVNEPHSADALSVSPVSKALRMGGVVHRYENRKMVDGDVFEEHVTRSNLLKGGSETKGCSQLAADSCTTIPMECTKSSEKIMNKARQLTTCTNTFLFGQTPTTVIDSQLLEIALDRDVCVDDMADEIVNMSGAERTKLLASFYEKRHPESSRLFGNLCQEVIDEHTSSTAVRRSPTGKNSVEIKESREEKSSDWREKNIVENEESETGVESAVLSVGRESENFVDSDDDRDLRWNRVPVPALDRILFA